MQVFVQARMSSARFPGKVLAPYRGVPIISQVVAAVRRALGADVPLTVVTSDEASDDPLAAYLSSVNIPVFRGALDDVVRRFRQALAERPADWVLRINGDSPAVGSAVLRAVVERAAGSDADLITTTFPRTFAKGNNAELLRVTTFLGIPEAELTEADREHVTRVYYRHPDRFRIVNVASSDPALAERSIVVDTVDDLERLERLSEDEIAALQGRPAVAERVS